MTYIVEFAKYDYRTDKVSDIDTYENFHVVGNFATESEAHEAFTTLKNERVSKWENELKTNTAPYNPFKAKGFMSNTPKVINGEIWRGEWQIFANTENEYWICRNDNDMEFRIRVRVEK